MLELDTPHGTARAHLHPADEPRAALVLGHGAGGGVTAPDLVAATAAALAADVSVALVEQPYRVAGRRSPAPAAQLDTAWIAVVEQLVRRSAGRPAAPHGRPLVRRACRLPHGRADRCSRCRVPRVPAAAAGTAGRAQPAAGARGGHGADCSSSRAQGDPFGIPPPSELRTVVLVPGNHSLRTAKPVTEAVQDWLSQQL